MNIRPTSRRAAVYAVFVVPMLVGGESLAVQGDPASGSAPRLVKSQGPGVAKKETKPEDKKPADKTDAKTDDAKKAGKPMQVGTYGDWGAFVAQGAKDKDKTCYALATPKDRAPAALKRDPAYVFISSRPGENVRNEVSVIMGFPLKENGDSKAEVAGSTFDLVAKGTNAWIKNPAEETRFVDALKKGSKLVIRAPSIKGNVTTDTYPLSGLSQALERVQKECP